MLEESGNGFKTVEYLKTPPSREQLEDLIRMLEIEPFELIRKSEPVYIQKFKNMDLSPDECIEAMIQYPILIERPIVVSNGKATICRPPEKLMDILKNG
jgi:arsenate reductase